MSGTRAGGLKAAATNRKLRGDDFYRRIGKKGGSVSCQGGFAAMPVELRRKYGRMGGLKSRRGPAKKKEGEYNENV